MKQITWLNSPESDSKSGIGNKAYNLSRLIKSDFSVPEAFTVTFASYQSFLKDNGLHEDLKEILTSIDDFSYPELENISHQAQEAILNGQFNSQDEEKILEAYGKIGLTEEVRNAGESAVDLIRGQKETQDVALRPTTNNRLLNKVLETKLNVSGKNVLLKSIKKCYASLFSVPALYLLETTELDFSSVKVGIIVQRMVDANKSGTAFSRNPVSGDTSEYVIESLWGLGSALKQGETTPDVYVVNKESNELTEKYLTRKETEIVRDSYSGSTKVRRLSPQKRDSRLLDNSQLNKIISQLMEVERIFGPVKVSFALERNKLRLVSVSELKRNRTDKIKETASRQEAEEQKIVEQGQGIAPGRSSGQIKQVGSPQEASREQGGILMINKCLSEFLPVINNFDGFIANKGSLSSSLAELAREIGSPGIVDVEYPLYSSEQGERDVNHQPDSVVIDGASGNIYYEQPSKGVKETKTSSSTAKGGEGYVTACKLQVSELEVRPEAEGAVILERPNALDREEVLKLARKYSVVWLLDGSNQAKQQQRQSYEQNTGDLPGYAGGENQTSSPSSIFDNVGVKRLHEISSMTGKGESPGEELEGIIVRDFPSLMELEDYRAQYILLDLEALRESVGDSRSAAVAKSISSVTDIAEASGADSAIRIKEVEDGIINKVVTEGIDTLVVPPEEIGTVERKLAKAEKRFILSQLRSLADKL